jgi:hypothetical protein
MFKIYYKIWVSLFYKINESQNESQNEGSVWSLILSLIVLTGINVMNYFFICFVFSVSIGINFNFIIKLYSMNRYLTISLISLILFLPNYFLLIHDGKHEILMKKYTNYKDNNLGVYYFLFSCSLILSLIFSMILFPDLFGLIKNKQY